MTEFAEQSAAGAKSAKAQDKDATLTQLVNLADDCKGCHDTYRQEKKDGGLSCIHL